MQTKDSPNKWRQRLVGIQINRTTAMVVIGIFMGAIIGIILYRETENRPVKLASGPQVKTAWQERGGQWPKTVSPCERLRLYAECAVFSEDVYDDPTSPIKIPKVWTRILDEVSNDKSETPRISWEKVYPEGKSDAPEFGFKVWEQPTKDRINIIIAFRGTNDRKDWNSNFRWITRKLTGEEDQYDLVGKLMPQVMDIIHRRHGNKALRIVTTGHSLGGGLAQHAAYTTKEIREVYVFDPSPVTGYYSIPGSEQNAIGKKIDRVYERGEVLSYARSLFRPFYGLSTQNPNITEAGFNLVEAKKLGMEVWFIKQHSMRELAKNLQTELRSCP